MKQKYQPLIDNRNESLWEEMNGHFQIILEESPENNFITTYNGSEITIAVDPNDINPAPFTHELLHLYLKYKNTMILQDLKQMTEDDHLLLYLFSQEVVNHISNCLEHYKMLPMFLSKGFDARDFVKDYDKVLMNFEDIKTLRRTYIKNGIYDGKAVQQFISKFFSMKSSSNTAHDYSDIFMALTELDPSLFAILEQFWNDWTSFKIGNPPQEYQLMLENFLDKMRSWIGTKTLIY